MRWFKGAFVVSYVGLSGCVLSAQSDAESALRRRAATEQQEEKDQQQAAQQQQQGNAGSGGPTVVDDTVPATGASTTTGAIEDAPVENNPTNPSTGGATPGWSTAPLMEGVQTVSNRSSVKVLVPTVQGAVDYRVIQLTDAVTVTTDGDDRETVNGTTITCAGYRQRNVYVTQRELLATIEVSGLSGTTKLVVEALDRPCPFTGVIGNAHHELARSGHGIPVADEGTFKVFTEAETVATFGSTILNGQGPAAQKGQPAAVNPPKVLSRTTIFATPLPATTATPVDTFFDGFDDSAQPTLIEAGTWQTNHDGLDIFGNAKWTMHSYMTDMSQTFVDRGQLHTVLADGGTENFSRMVAFPKQVAAMSASDYLHVTYEVSTHITDRRYWWISMCGADTAGQTVKADGTPNFFLKANSSLQIADGNNPNSAGMNCVMVFPKNGNRYFPLPPDNTPPETDVRVLIYGKGTGATGHNVDPDIYHYDWMGPEMSTWYRQLDAQGNAVDKMLDGVNANAPRVRFDVFVKKGRVVLFADGQQKLCNDFPPSLVSQAEAAVGFGQVLYHTSAEHNDIAPDHAGGAPLMRHTYENMPFHDRRDWDNLGFQEHSGLPTQFDESLCYVDTRQ